MATSPRQLAGEPEESSGCRHEIALDLRDTEDGRLGCHHQIRGQNEFGATGEGRTVDGCDQRLLSLTLNESAEPTTLC